MRRTLRSLNPGEESPGSGDPDQMTSRRRPRLTCRAGISFAGILRYVSRSADQNHGSGCDCATTRPPTFAGATTIAAKPGDVLILWGTGFGPTSPAAPPGRQVPADRTYSTVLPPQ